MRTALTCVVLFVPVSLAAEPNQANYDRAVERLYQGEFSEAIKILDEVIRLDPKHAQAYRNRGLAYFQINEMERAIKNYSECIKLEPKDAQVYYNRGLALRKKKDFDAAIKDFTEAIRLDPNSTLAYDNRGLTFFQKGDVDAAIKDYTKAIQLDQEFARAYRNRSAAFSRKRDFDAAFKDCNSAIELASVFVDDFQKQLMETRRRLRKMKAQADKIIEAQKKGLEPPDFEREAVIEDFSLKSTTPERGVSLLFWHERARAEGFVSRGNVYADKGDYKSAAKDFGEAYRLDPGNAEVCNCLGLVYMSVKQFDRAVGFFDEAIDVESKFALAYYNRGRAYHELKNPRKAVADHAMAVRLDPDLKKAEDYTK